MCSYGIRVWFNSVPVFLRYSCDKPLLQFVVLPFLGFAVVKVAELDQVMGITLLIITSSPGGAYSNWFCS